MRPTTEPRSLPVGAVARLAGVTVRTLHHYDDIGLLAPSGRSVAGYRRYDDVDLERLQRILFYRELGFGLDEIRDVMTDGGADVAAEHQRHQQHDHCQCREEDPRRPIQRPVGQATTQAVAQGEAHTDQYQAEGDEAV